MMALSFKGEPHRTLPGATLFSDSRTGAWLKPTGVYFPKAINVGKTVNVVVWLHGFYVKSIEGLFYSDDAKVREQIEKTCKNAMLVAPWLGHGYDKDHYLTIKDIEGDWGQRFLDQVLNALKAPALGKLIIACHSAGGAAMRRLIGSLGNYTGDLTECWGFDCLYGENAAPDDAGFWFDMGLAGHPVSIFYGPSTLPQSVKLDLMVRGLATSDGASSSPPGYPVKNVKVTIGVDPARNIDDLMGVKPPKPHSRIPPVFDADFVANAVKRLSKSVTWPKDVHYLIARQRFFEQLKKAHL